MYDLRALTDNLVITRFPELKNVKIKVEFNAAFKDGLLEYNKVCAGEFYIQANTILQEAPLMALEAGLAHELAHILIELRMTKIGAVFDQMMYHISKRYRADDESETDKVVVLRGLGEHLIALNEYRKQIGLPEYDDNGLKVWEVKQLIDHVKDVHYTDFATA